MELNLKNNNYPTKEPLHINTTEKATKDNKKALPMYPKKNHAIMVG